MESILSWLNMFGDFCLKKALPAAMIALVGIFVIRLVMKLLKTTLEKTNMEKTLSKLICAAIRIVLYVLLGLTVASGLGIDVTGVVALASVLTLVVSLSVQAALTNVIGGFTLLYTRPFATGDYVEIAGRAGTVREIGLTYTKLNTFDNKVISIPNSAVTAAEIVNYTVAGTRRVDITVSAAYTAPVELVLDALREAGNVATALQTPAPFAAVKNYGESAIEYVLQLWCNGADYWTTLYETNKRIKDVFDARGVTMTYPHINVHMEK